MDADADGDIDGTGDLEITTHLRQYDGSELDCAAATVSELRLELRDEVVTIACDDAPFVWYGVPAGRGELIGRGAGSQRAYAGVLLVDVARDDRTAVDLLLDCQEKTGVMTVCGER